MKRSLTLFGAGLALALSLAPLNGTPLANSLGSQPVLAQAQQQSLELELVGQRRIVRKNWRGQEEIAWQSLGSSFLRPAPTVQPGDILRYSISGNNRTDQPISGLILTDDLPSNTVYVMNSAQTLGGGTAQITYSIDGGKNYTANPTIQVTLADGSIVTRPAPADRYTHVRWNFQSAVPAKSSVSGLYQVQVQ
ncbi:hypothetical protein [Prochlorothrix hollandica]|uniref:hypothetical protein n=1 Tax=Prochlorothrix hollandica TaxID=1223 RepID=UPI0033408620